MCICLIIYCYSLLFAFQQALARNKLFWVLYIVIISSLNVQISKHCIFGLVSIYGEGRKNIYDLQKEIDIQKEKQCLVTATANRLV